MIERATKLARQVLKEDGCILILGGRSTNFTDDFRSNERLIFWDSTSAADTKKPGTIPTKVELVLMTRFLKHIISAAVKTESKDRNIPFIGPLETGQIKMIIESARQSSSEKTEQRGEMPQLTIKPNPFAGLARLLREELSSEELSLDILESESVIARLLECARQRWPEISQKRVLRALRRILAKEGIQQSSPAPSSAQAESVTRESFSGLPKTCTSQAQVELDRFKRDHRRLQSTYQRLKRRERVLVSKLQNCEASLEQEQAARKKERTDAQKVHNYLMEVLQELRDYGFSLKTEPPSLSP